LQVSSYLSSISWFFSSSLCSLLLFFFNHPPPPDIYTLSLHDALPISLLSSLAGNLLLTGSLTNVLIAERADRMGARLTFAEHARDRKSTRLNSSHLVISYAVFCLKKKKKQRHNTKLIRYTNRPRECTS